MVDGTRARIVVAVIKIDGDNILFQVFWFLCGCWEGFALDEGSKVWAKGEERAVGE